MPLRQGLLCHRDGLLPFAKQPKIVGADFQGKGVPAIQFRMPLADADQTEAYPHLILLPTQ